MKQRRRSELPLQEEGGSDLPNELRFLGEILEAGRGVPTPSCNEVAERGGTFKHIGREGMPQFVKDARQLALEIQG